MTLSPSLQFPKFILITGMIVSGFVYTGSAFTGLLIIIFGYLSLRQAFKKNYWIKYPLSNLMLTYLAWLIAISIVSTVPDASLITIVVLIGLPITYLAWTNIQNPTPLWSILRTALWLGGILLAIWAIWQVFNHIGYGWAVGPLIDRNAFAALMNALWFPAVYLFLISKPSPKHWNTLLKGAGLFIIGVALFATSSRGGIATWALLLPILLWSGYRNTHSKWLVASIPLIMMMAFFCSSLLLHSSVADRTYDLAQDPSTNARLLIWKSSIQMILAHPFFGTGWGTFVYYYPAYRSLSENTTSGFFAHNDYLQFAIEGGIPALLLQLGILLGLLFQLKRSLKCATNENGLESIALLLGALALFIHASVNFIFYFAFMNILIGLYLARATQLVESAKQIKLPNFNQVSPPVKGMLIGFILLFITGPFIIHLTAQLCLSGTQPGLKALKLINSNINTYDIAKLISAIYPEEGIAQGYMLETSMNALENSDGIEMPGRNFQRDLLNEALVRFDFIRTKTANNPNVGVQEAKTLIKYHTFLNGNTAYEKAHKILNTNLEINPFHANSMIALARLQVAEGHRLDAIYTLQLAMHSVLSRRDYQLLQVEILRQSSAPKIIPELDEIEKKLHTVRSDSETGKPLILAPHFSEDIDAQLQVIAKGLNVIPK